MTTPDPTPPGGATASSVRHEIRHHARRLARPTSVRQLPARGPVTLVACLLGTLLAVASAAGPAAEGVTVATVAIASAALAVGWTRLIGLPSRQGTLVTVSLSAFLLLCSVVVPADGATLRWTPAALALGVVASFVHQLVRRDGRPRVVTSLSGTLVALGILAAGVTWVAATTLPSGPGVVATAAAGVVGGAVTEWACHRARLWSAIAPCALLCAAAASCAVAAVMEVALLPALLLGVGVAAIGLASRAVMSPLPALVSARVQAVSGVSSVLLAGPLVELLGRHLVG